jgi:hypothetical protein
MNQLFLRNIVMNTKNHLDEYLIQQRQLATFDFPEARNLAFLQARPTDPACGDDTLEGVDGTV